MSASRRTRGASRTAKRSTKKTTSSRKASGRKPAKKTSAKKASTKKPAARKKASAKTSRKPAKKTAARKPAKKTAARKPAKKAAKRAAPAKKTAAKRPARKPAKKTAARKPAKKTAAKKTASKRTKSPARKPAAKKTTAKKTAKKPARKVSLSAARKAVVKKAVAKAVAKKKAAPAKKAAATKSKTTAKPAKATGRKKSEKLPETKSAVAAKRAVKKAAATAEAKPKKRRERKPKPPAKTMNAPEPIREVLVFEDMPDVSRALTATARRAGARGHLQPNVGDEHADESDEQIPLDATLIMNTLAVDVQPKIEDNYDYSILDEFRESGLCPRPTRMVNTGCGGGEAAVYFAKLGFNCVGIDPDRADVGLARERAWLATVDIDFMVGDLFETPNLLPAESFGLAVDRGAFYQIEDERERQRYLANIRRLLFKGGVLLLSAGFFPLEDDAKSRKSRAKKGDSILLAREGGVVVQEMRAAGFDMLKRVLRPTNDSGELGELILYLRK